MSLHGVYNGAHGWGPTYLRRKDYCMFATDTHNAELCIGGAEYCTCECHKKGGDSAP